ncbi:MAG: hypothetical protein ACTIMB_12170 [Brachybacterium alimentarium]
MVTASDGRADSLSLVEAGDAAVRSSSGALQLRHLDLIRIAEIARQNEITPLLFSLFDDISGPLPPDEERELSDELLETLQVYGTTELVTQLEDEHPEISIVGLKLRNRSNGLILDIRQNGYISATSEQFAKMFLTKAWLELGLK